MTVILASYAKEFTLFVRDKAGMAILILMPVFLTLVMSLVQDSAWNASNSSGAEILFLDQDQGPLGVELKKGLSGVKGVRLVTSLNNEALTEQAIRKALDQGEYRFAVIAPPGTSEKIMQRADDLVAAIMAEKPVEPGLPASSIRLMLAPDLQGPLRDAFVEKTTLACQTLEVEMLLNSVLVRIKKLLPERLRKADDYVLGALGDEYSPRPGELLGLEVEPRVEDNELMFSSVQHNVPAWTLFGMFFIAIPLSGGIIRERNNGVLARLMTMSASLWQLFLGRLIFFLSVCFVQFGLLLLMGLYILPLFGLPVLQTGPHPWAAVLTALSAALAANGFGLLVGSFFSAPEKAAVFSAVGIVILSAIGGVMVPVFIMPPVLRAASLLSPIGWGLEAFNELFVKGGGLADVWVNCLLLLTLSIICLIVSSWKAKSFFSPR